MCIYTCCWEYWLFENSLFLSSYNDDKYTPMSHTCHISWDICRNVPNTGTIQYFHKCFTAAHAWNSRTRYHSVKYFSNVFLFYLTVREDLKKISMTTQKCRDKNYWVCRRESFARKLLRCYYAFSNFILFRIRKQKTKLSSEVSLQSTCRIFTYKQFVHRNFFQMYISIYIRSNVVSIFRCLKFSDGVMESESLQIYKRVLLLWQKRTKPLCGY